MLLRKTKCKRGSGTTDEVRGQITGASSGGWVLTVKRQEQVWKCHGSNEPNFFKGVFEEEDGEVKRGAQRIMWATAGKDSGCCSHWWCLRLNVCILAKYIHSILTPNVTVLGGDGSGKRAVFTNGMCPYKRDLTARSPLLPCEDTGADRHLWARERDFTDPELAAAALSDFLDFRSRRSKSCGL